MDNFSCESIQQAYTDYKEPLCNDVNNGFVELLALRVLSLPLEIGLCIVGIRFVIRNKVDVPEYSRPKPKKPKKKDEKKEDDDKAEDAASDEEEDRLEASGDIIGS